MRIAQVAPLYESVPPKYYGGTERVVSYLTEELIKEGHQVTLFASGDSMTQAHLMAPCPRSLRLDSTCTNALAYHILQLEYVFKHETRFDLIHFHTDYMHFPLTRKTGVTSLTTLHGRLDLPDLIPVYREFFDIPLVSISNAQREPIPWANWQRTVYHGLPKDLHRFHKQKGHYLAFLGRVSPEKGLDRAIEIAQRVNKPLKIAAKVDPVDREYFYTKIQPQLKNPLIHFIGEIGEKEKNDFLGNAFCLLFSIDWPEPFGIVMIEAMACGTPILAFKRGSVPEIMTDQETGFIVNNVDEAVQAIDKIGLIPRARCRHVFEERFTSARMAQSYLEIYEQLLHHTLRSWESYRGNRSLQ